MGAAHQLELDGISRPVLPQQEKGNKRCADKLLSALLQELVHGSDQAARRQVRDLETTKKTWSRAILDKSVYRLSQFWRAQRWVADWVR